MKEQEHLRKLMEAVDADTEKRRADIAKWEREAMLKHRGREEPAYDEKPTQDDWDSFLARKQGDRQDVNEDWGSSDWYTLLKSMDQDIDAEGGVNPKSIQRAAEYAADHYHSYMGYDDMEQTKNRIIQAWMDMTERGRNLKKMFAPVNEAGIEGELITKDRGTAAGIARDIIAGARESLYKQGHDPSNKLVLRGRADLMADRFYSQILKAIDDELGQP
jgi:hypothetical protein